MIIWRGLGFLAFPAALIGFLLVELLVNAANGPGYYVATGWPKVLGGGVAAIVLWQLAGFLESKGWEKNDLFFIPLRAWAVIVFGFGIYAAYT